MNTTTTFDQYNNRGQLKLKTDPLLKTTQLFYDDAGRLSYVIDRKNQRVDYSYTPTSKIDTISYPDYSTVHFIYNQHDDLTGMQDGLGTTTYVYDAAHRLTSQTDANGFTVGYGYDANGNLTELTYPGNKKVIYTYDELNRLKTVTIDWLASKPVATYYYDDAGRLDYLVNFNGSITDYGYDNANRLTTLANKKSDNSIIADYQFTLDGNGNRTQIVQNEPLALTLTTNTVSYGYNAKKNRLLTANTTNFSYDDEGQLSWRDYDSYTFDEAHRLININSSSNYINYYYDGRGNRLSTDRDWWSYGTSYVYDAGGNLLMEVDSIRGTSYFIHGLGLMAMVTDTGNVYTYHFNAVGSTIAMTDSTQAIVNKYSYDPFGKILSEQETVAQPFKFVGQYGVMTEQNGMYYMRARYYDPEVGRFISEDPIGFEGGGPNLYAYASNNPLLLIDPLGLATTVIITYDKFLGMEYGSHAALLVDNGGDPYLYDPRGSYRNDIRGSGQFFTGTDADLGSYIRYQESTGSTVSIFSFNTSATNESAIVSRIESASDPGFWGCAIGVCNVLNGVGPFNNLGSYTTPGGLADALYGIQSNGCGQ